MYLTSFFTDGGTPATGLTPTINAWTVDGSQVITAETMTEVAGGFYAYNFTGYDSSNEYMFRAEVPSLSISERYSIATNDVDSQRNQGVIKQILGLVQSNFIMSGQTYDANGNLQSAYVYTYENPAALSADTRLHEYAIEASYNASGQLITYKVTDI